MLHVKNIITCCLAKMIISHYFNATSKVYLEIFNNKMCIYWRCTYDLLDTFEVSKRELGRETTEHIIISLVQVSFYDLPLVRPVFPDSRAIRGRAVHAVRRPTTVNDQKIRAIVEEESLPTMARSIRVNGHLTTRRPTFSPDRCMFRRSYKP